MWESRAPKHDFLIVAVADNCASKVSKLSSKESKILGG